MSFNFSSIIGPKSTCGWLCGTFSVYSAGAQLPSEPGIYILTRTVFIYYAALYIGQSVDVSRRVSDHYREDSEMRNCTQHVHFLRVSGGEFVREELERAMIGHYNPPLNELHRTGPSNRELKAIVRDRLQNADDSTEMLVRVLLGRTSR